MNIERVAKVFGDRVIVRKLKLEEKVGSIVIPEALRERKTAVEAAVGNDTLWLGEVEKFGLDTRCGEAYDLKKGDKILVEPAAEHCHSIQDEKGDYLVWVPEEFISAKKQDDLVIPLGDRVLVRPEKQEEKKGSLYIPDTAKGKPQTGEVVSVGGGKVESDGSATPLDVKESQKVLYGKYSGFEFKVKAESMVIMHQDDILGVLEGEAVLA